MASLLFVTEKRNGVIKVIKVAVGSKQITYDGYNKHNGLSPKVNTDSVLLTGLIYAHEHRSVAVLDIENYFLHAENEENVLMLIRGKIAEQLFKVDPKLCGKYVITLKQGGPILYVKLAKDFYVILRRAMLFYKNIRIHLETNFLQMDSDILVK